jgi:hypothetical protein
MDGYLFVPEDNLIGAPPGGEEDARDAGGVHAGDEGGGGGLSEGEGGGGVRLLEEMRNSGNGFLGGFGIKESGGVLHRDRLRGNAILDAAMYDLRRMKEASCTDGSCPCVHDG